MPPLASVTPMNERKVTPKSSYLLTGQRYTDQAIGYAVADSYLAGGGAQLHHVFWPHTLCAFIDSFMILCPAEQSQYKLHRKPHKTVMDNSAIAVSLAHSTAKKGGI